MEWCMWWLQQHGGQQQHGQLFGVVVVVRVVAAVLVRAIGEGSEVAERSFCGLVRVGQQCSRRVILPSSSGPFLPPPPWFRTFDGCQLACAPRCARMSMSKVRTAVRFFPEGAGPLWGDGKVTI